jgi:hypothetical protein
MRRDKTNTEFAWWPADFPAAANGDKRGPECQKISFLRLKRKKEGDSAFSDFIGFCFVYYRAFGIYGFYPGIGRIVHPIDRMHCIALRIAMSYKHQMRGMRYDPSTLHTQDTTW